MRPDDDINDFAHLPTVDEAKLAKQDLWRKAKEAVEIRRAAQAPPAQASPAPVAPEPAVAPVAPKRKLKVKLRVPPASRAHEQELLPPEATEAPWSLPEEAFEPPKEEKIPTWAAKTSLPTPKQPDPAPSRQSHDTDQSAPPNIRENDTEEDDIPAWAAKTTLPTPRKRAPQAAEKPAESVPSKLKDDQPRSEKAASQASAAEVSTGTEPATEAAGDNTAPAETGAPAVPLLGGVPLEIPPNDKETRFKKLWDKIGGRSLALSVGIHLVLFIIAGFIYFSYSENQRIDFLPGGGTQQGEQASQALEAQVNRKKTRWLNKRPPMQRIAVETSMSSITLPEAKLELLDLPLTKDFLGAGKMGSMGFGKSGAGGGFGNGIGVGGKSGITFTPLSMFGKKIIGKRIAVVMDVSKSMTSYLEDVVKELDRVASGSPVILYYGCGLMRPDDEPIDETVQRTQARDFERFWRIWQGDSMIGFSGVDLKKVTFPANEKIPLNDLYRFFARRNNTFFLDYNGMDFAWTALLCQEIRNADTVYWFSDFEDNVDERQMKTVLDNLLVRRQRLYIHPQTHGSSFQQVLSQIVEPSGGDVVEPKKSNR